VSDIVVLIEEITPAGAQVEVRYMVSTTDAGQGGSTAWVDAALSSEARNAAILADARAYADVNMGTTPGSNYILGGQPSDWQTISKQADEQRLNDTLTDDTELRFPTVAGEAYRFKLFVPFQAPATPGIKYRVYHTGITTGTRRAIERGAGGAAPAASVPITSLDGLTADLSVEPPCDKPADYKCATHAVSLLTELTKSTHLAEPGEHAVIRDCLVHGPEALG
jgi:hypothetical protein